jgi:hypothetical protein
MTGFDTIVQFYVPQRELPGGTAPETIDEYWAWAARHTSVGEIGRYTWTLKTYLYLKAHGAAVRLVTAFPSRGIVISHRDFLPLHLRPRPDVFLVCVKPDRKEHTWAHFYVVQNELDRVFRGPNRHRARQVMHWPQPHLVPRDAGRGTRCERVRYFGRPMNLAPELSTPAWSARLRELGFDWANVPSSQWNDYGAVDVTVSVRGFGEAAESQDPLLDPHSKPPSKLINSWLAGVPAIVGPESPYRNLRRGPLDFIEANSPEAVIEALVDLRRNPARFEAMARNGLERSRAFATEAVCEQWAALLEHDIIPTYEAWIRRGWLERFWSSLKDVAGFVATPGNLSAIRLHRQGDAG